MEMYILTEVIPCIMLLIAFIYGIVVINKNEIALYLKIIVFAVGCFALSKLYTSILVLCFGIVPEGFHLGYLGIFGCFQFILSANYGQIDSLIDEGTEKERKYRIFALLAPLLLILFQIPLFLCQEIEIGMKILLVIVQIPAILAIYYNLKHIILPDNGFGFVKAIRPYNVTAIILAYINCLSIIFSVYTLNVLFVIFSILTALCQVALILTAVYGTKKWKL